MSGNVGGRGDYDAIVELRKAVEKSNSDRAKESLTFRELITKALVQLRILNVHQAEMRGDVVEETDLEHIK
jgi:hypothetical protein